MMAAGPAAALKTLLKKFAVHGRLFRHEHPPQSHPEPDPSDFDPLAMPSGCVLQGFTWELGSLGSNSRNSQTFALLPLFNPML